MLLNYLGKKIAYTRYIVRYGCLLNIHLAIIMKLISCLIVHILNMFFLYDHILSACNHEDFPYRVITSVQSFVVEGFSTEGSPPELVTSEDTSKEKPLLQVLFETNPMDRSCDQRVKLEAQPLQVVYDAATFNQLRDLFAPPKNISLQQ